MIHPLPPQPAPALPAHRRTGAGLRRRLQWAGRGGPGGAGGFGEWAERRGARRGAARRSPARPTAAGEAAGGSWLAAGGDGSCRSAGRRGPLAVGERGAGSGGGERGWGVRAALRRRSGWAPSTGAAAAGPPRRQVPPHGWAEGAAGGTGGPGPARPPRLAGPLPAGPASRIRAFYFPLQADNLLHQLQEDFQALTEKIALRNILFERGLPAPRGRFQILRSRSLYWTGTDVSRTREWGMFFFPEHPTKT